MRSYYAPAERIDEQLLRSQIKIIDSSYAMDTILQAAPDLLLVINSHRQVVALNKAFAESLGIVDLEKALGLRFGEVLQCRYAFDEPSGCGTTSYCSSCGAVVAMMAAIDDDSICERICALKTSKNGVTIDSSLYVRSQPVVIDGNRFVLVYARDISQTQLDNMEYDFMQNMSAMLNASRSYGVFIQYGSPDNVLLQRLNKMTDRTLQEINLQSVLKLHSHSAPKVNFEKVSLTSIRNMVFSVVIYREFKIGKSIKEKGLNEDLCITTDPILASRVIISMLQNALEDTKNGESVRLSITAEHGKVVWQVWNNAYMPEDIQLRVFQRYFSTKAGNGRGHGTYMMKYLGEKCLGGKVSFTSTMEHGTIFSFSLPAQ